VKIDKRQGGVGGAQVDSHKITRHRSLHLRSP